MTVSREIEAEIAQLFHAEHWKVGTISAQLHVNEDVVRRMIGRVPRKERTKTATPPPAALAPYVDFIRETLERYPKLCSTGLWDMLREASSRTEAPLPMDARLGEHVPDCHVIPHDLGGYDVERWRPAPAAAARLPSAARAQ